ncbi:hypothetical protein HC231_02940 [Brenneria izadpanahii]|uniref:Uncharacterized protein n=2 Tax=Brenneria izadpanahii TaxID=2722756 RepID=A0ABX7UP60_9GAMM|nr:hypothetical protein HC231_02940 [Brenneria izadpanahii]
MKICLQSRGDGQIDWRIFSGAPMMVAGSLLNLRQEKVDEHASIAGRCPDDRA